MWRAGFGPAVEQLGELSKFSPKQFYKALVIASDKKPGYINVADEYLQDMYMDDGTRQKKKELDKDERKMIQQKSRESIRNLNLYWMHEMVNSGAQLREKMAFFWHGHFACRNQNIFFQQGLLDVIRRNALGNFRSLLKEVSKSAAMLNFLNNQQNKKDHPNDGWSGNIFAANLWDHQHLSHADVVDVRNIIGRGNGCHGRSIFDGDHCQIFTRLYRMRTRGCRTTAVL